MSSLFAGFDRIAARSAGSRPFRIAILTALSWFIGVEFGAAFAAGVALASVISELLILVTERCRGLRARKSNWWVLLRVISILSMSGLWTFAAALCYVTGGDAQRITAMVFLCSLLMAGLSFSARSRQIAIIFCVLPGSALLALPLVVGGFPRTHTGLTLFLLIYSLAYLLTLTRDLVSSAAALRKANDRLTETEQALRLETERAHAANSAKSRFLAVMSHELRTPMNGVLGMAHALEQTPLSARQREHVGMLLRSGEGLMTILNDLLDLSKVEAGKLDLEALPFDLGELGRGVLRTMDGDRRRQGRAPGL